MPSASRAASVGKLKRRTLRMLCYDAEHNPRPLHGVPILLKDNIATMDKMNNTGNFMAFVTETRVADIFQLDRMH